MIALRLIDPTPEIDLRFLTVTDVPFILLAIVLLIVMYFKVKKAKQKRASSIVAIVPATVLEL
ncbi:hypothetical protein [Aequorivita capsosiphonis]|uniref:hypothetical protein n=1 Tax=Aequorivita capsosiphonis TaxID=487317 RepID=UPI000415F3C5|nr:hypothetical protein [Aequorivita capsosiphonis]